jgi:DNA end-binding protein Ku
MGWGRIYEKERIFPLRVLKWQGGKGQGERSGWRGNEAADELGAGLDERRRTKGDGGESSMAGATIWKGYIHFGKIDVPVRLHTAVREERVQFHLLHRRDEVGLRQQMICAYEKHPVPPEEQSKGFEMEDGKYLIVDPAELEQTAPESNRKIEVHEFVKTAQIDPIFYNRSYYLEPDISDFQGKGFAAIIRALMELDVAGICTWVMRKRSYFGALQARGKTLRLSTLRYQDEVIPVGSLELQEVPLSEKELKIGSELIEKLAAPFEPGKFENEHQKKLRDMIEKKARGEKIVVLPPRHLKATESDQLLQALEASLKKVA